MKSPFCSNPSSGFQSQKVCKPTVLIRTSTSLMSLASSPVARFQPHDCSRVNAGTEQLGSVPSDWDPAPGLRSFLKCHPEDSGRNFYLHPNTPYRFALVTVCPGHSPQTTIYVCWLPYSKKLEFLPQPQPPSQQVGAHEALDKSKPLWGAFAMVPLQLGEKTSKIGKEVGN